MPIGEMIKVVEVGKEVSKEMPKEAKSALEQLDKPLNATEVKETAAFAEEDFKGGLKELDKPLNAETEAGSPEVGGRQGGRFGDIFKEGEGDTVEVHHMPADSVTELSRNDGPAIRMEKADHRETASCGSSREAREYREHQKDLVNEGKFDEAVQMDIDDIREKFGGKYDDAINEMLEYVDELKEAGKI